MEITREKADKYQGLFNYLNDQYGINPTIEGMNDLIAEVDKAKQLILSGVMHWVAVKDDLPSDDAQVLVEWNNGRFGVNEYWESDECWKYQFDKINVVRWQEIKPPCV